VESLDGEKVTLNGKILFWFAGSDILKTEEIF
jgi:hypothetical protein